MSAGTSADIAPDVVGRLGVRLHPRGTGADAGVLLRLGLRRNPLRAQLLVSTVLGKHIPTDPRLVRAAGLLLGRLVGDLLAGQTPRELPVDLLHAAVRAEPGAAEALHAAATPPESPRDVLVLGFAETATALGHCVAEGLGGADYLHSTRRPVAGIAQAGGFSEEHSHATEHLLLPADPALLRGDRPLVLVDDELSTGRTALNTITALHLAAPRERYVVAALVDVRDEDAQALREGVAALGARLDVVSLARAAVELPGDVVERAAEIREELDRDAATDDVDRAAADVAQVRLDELGWPAGLPVGGRHGFLPAHHRLLDDVLPGLAVRLAEAAGLRPGERVLVLGTEELMALPLRLAQVLADTAPTDAAPTDAAPTGTGPTVAFSTTTRSPAVVVAAEGYALTSGISFPAHDDPADGPGRRFAYNLGGRHTWDHVLVVVDPPAVTPALASGLLAALGPLTRRTTVVVTP